MNGECNELVFEIFCVVGNVFCVVLVFYLCFFSVDCCLVIVRFFDFKKIWMMVRFKIVFFFVWIIFIIYCVLCLIINMKVILYFMVIVGVFCYVIIIVCYIVIIIKVCICKIGNFWFLRGSCVEEVVECCVIVIIVIVVLVFIISWVFIMYFCFVYVGSNVGIVYNWVRIVVLSNLVLNLWIYCFCVVEFCKIYKKLLGCDRNCVNLRSWYWLKKL